MVPVFVSAGRASRGAALRNSASRHRSVVVVQPIEEDGSLPSDLLCEKNLAAILKPEDFGEPGSESVRLAIAVLAWIVDEIDHRLDLFGSQIGFEMEFLEADQRVERLRDGLGFRISVSK